MPTYAEDSLLGRHGVSKTTNPSETKKGVVVVMTGQPNVQESAALQKQGVVDYLVKPVSPDQITALVGEAVKKNYIFQGKS